MSNTEYARVRVEVQWFCEPSTRSASHDREAEPTDLATIGPFSTLLVRTHHDFDQERFIAATPPTERGMCWRSEHFTALMPAASSFIDVIPSVPDETGVRCMTTDGLGTS